MVDIRHIHPNRGRFPSGNSTSTSILAVEFFWVWTGVQMAINRDRLRGKDTAVSSRDTTRQAFREPPEQKPSSSSSFIRVTEGKSSCTPTLLFCLCSQSETDSFKAAFLFICSFTVCSLCRSPPLWVSQDVHSVADRAKSTLHAVFKIDFNITLIWRFNCLHLYQSILNQMKIFNNYRMKHLMRINPCSTTALTKEESLVWTSSKMRRYPLND